MKKSDIHILIAIIFITPHLNVWVALALAALHFLRSCIWLTRE